MVFNIFYPERGQSLFKVSAGLLLCMFLLILDVPTTSGAEEAIQVTALAEESLPAAPAEAGTALCSHIKPFKDADELMYQLYVSLEDDCLLKMDPKELSKIWGIPMLDIVDYRKPTESSSLKEKREPLPGDHDHLLLRVGYHPDYPYISGFGISQINTNDYDKYPFFPHNEYPKLLPKPLLCFKKIKMPCHAPHRQRGKYIGDQTFAWFNADQTRMLYMNSIDGIVNRIYLYDFVTPAFIDKCKYDEDWEY